MQTNSSISSGDQRIINALLAERDEIDRKIATLKRRRDHLDTMMAIARVRHLQNRKIQAPGKQFHQGLRLIQGGRIKAFVPVTESTPSRNLYIVPVA